MRGYAGAARRPLAQADDRSNPASRWGLVGNVVAEHQHGGTGEVLRGSKHFSPGTKVYCLPAQWGDGYERCVAVGIARRPRRWITVVMQTNLIENWRAQVIYQPAVLRRLEAGVRGFDRQFRLQWESREAVEGFLAALAMRPGVRVHAAPRDGGDDQVVAR